MQAPGTTPPPDSPPSGGGDSAFDTLLGTDELRTTGEKLLAWANRHLLTFDTALQVAILFAALAPAALFGPQLKRFISTQIAPRAPYGFLRRGAQAFAHIATPIALYVTLQAAVIVCGSIGQPRALIEAAVSLLTAWIVIRMVTLVIRSPLWSRVAFYIAWPLAALDAFGVLDDVVRQLDSFSIPLSTNEQGVTVDISALDIVRAVVVFVGLFWVANLANRFLKGRIKAIDELTPSLKALLEKILDVLAPLIALLIALQLVGFNLATLTIFGGALGLGVGLGLQRTISNFVAGFTLIADKSIKPGDVVEVEDTFGWVTQMNARYVSIRTRDGTEHLIPNDKFIEGGVVNWSFADRIVRLHAGIGVSYATRDLGLVKRLCEETALTVDRVLSSPKPVCNLMRFGDSSVDFDLRFWINDPANGVSNVRSGVLLAIWDKLHEAGIEIPFPQRDVHIKSLPANTGADFAAAPPKAKAATGRDGH